MMPHTIQQGRPTQPHCHTDRMTLEAHDGEN